MVDTPPVDNRTQRGVSEGRKAAALLEIVFNNASKLNPGAAAVVKKSNTGAEVVGDRAASRDAVNRDGFDASFGNIERREPIGGEGAWTDVLIEFEAMVSRVNGAEASGSEENDAKASDTAVIEATGGGFKVDIE